MWNRPESGLNGETIAPQPAATSTPIPIDAKPTRIGAPSLMAIGRSVVVIGDLTAEEDLTVDGRVEGRIDLRGHTLTIGPNAKIMAAISAKTATVFGAVSGTMVVHEKLDIRLGAIIEGEVTCARLSIQDGAVVTGKVTTQGRSSKQKDAATEAALPVAS
jgi:cytoskeletal protein CcmA (bactofilin family)